MGLAGCELFVARATGSVVNTPLSPPFTIPPTVPSEWLKKEVWLLDLKDMAHYSNDTVWHFPGEPPSQRAVIGKVSDVYFTIGSWFPSRRPM